MNESLTNFLHTIFGATSTSNDRCLKQTDDLKKLMIYALRDQLDFYFGDSNLRKDKFLARKLIKDSLYPLKNMLDFNRIKWMFDSYDQIVTGMELNNLCNENRSVLNSSS